MKGALYEFCGGKVRMEKKEEKIIEEKIKREKIPGK